MRIVLGKAAHPHDPMQRARGFIAVTASEFGHAKRQIAIGFQALIEHLHMAGTIHRLERIHRLFAGMLFVNFDDKHMLLIVVPMAGFFPELAVDHLRRVYLDITIAVLFAAHVILKRGVDFPAVGMPENLARRLFLHVVKVHLATKFAMVALFGLFKKGHVFLEFFLAGKGHAIDPLKHLAITVAAPIGPGHRHQFERIRRKLTGVLQMRPTAEILPGPMPIHAQRFVAGDRLDQLDLEGLVIVLVMLDGAGTIPDLGFDGVTQVDDFLHLFLDQAQIFGRERLGAVKIVIPAIGDDRADGDLDVGPKLLHGARHHMRKVMADQF